MVSGTHAVLKDLVIYMQGSLPDRGRSPVEWGEIPSIHQSVCPSYCLTYKGSEGFGGV